MNQMLDSQIGVWQQFQHVEALSVGVEQPQCIPADAGDEIGLGCQHRGEIPHPRIAAILHQHITRAHRHATQRFGGGGLGDRRSDPPRADRRQRRRRAVAAR